MTLIVKNQPMPVPQTSAGMDEPVPSDMQELAHAIDLGDQKSDGANDTMSPEEEQMDVWNIGAEAGRQPTKRTMRTELEEKEAEDKALLEGELYIAFTECYIYEECGRQNGEPITDSDIVYDLQPQEVVLIDAEERYDNYCRAYLPKKGFVYMPENQTVTVDEAKEAEAKWDKDKKEGKNVLEKAAEEAAANEQAGRRNFAVQKFYQLERELEIDEETNPINKCMQNKWIKKIVFFFRQKPFLPGLIIIIIQGVIEVIIFYDIITDVVVVDQLLLAKENSAKFLFMISVSLLLAPYFIAWCAVSQFFVTKVSKTDASTFWIVLTILYDIAPIGVAMLMINDFYHLIEYIALRPIFYLVTGGKQLRTISFEELGYYKLRRVSEIFAESIPQALVQAYLLAVQYEGVEWFSVTLALISSVIVLCFWLSILFVESRKNGLTLTEYIPIVFRGSFTFVPMLPAIERGSENGLKVNWTYYKMSLDGVGHLAKSLTQQSCLLNTCKISGYTIRGLHRWGCRYMGTMINNCNTPVTLIVSRLEEEVRHLFEMYDTDQSWSFDFHEFSRVISVMTARNKQVLYKKELVDLFLKLADSVLHEVWLLDLIVKIRGSVEFEHVLDFELPLYNSLQTENIHMMSLLTWAGYRDYNENTFSEFQVCVAEAVTGGKIQAALALCENIGVPIVIRVVSGEDMLVMDEDNQRSDPYVKVSVAGEENKTTVVRETLNPVFNEDLLFIIPFEHIDMLIGKGAEPAGGEEIGRRGHSVVDMNTQHTLPDRGLSTSVINRRQSTMAPHTRKLWGCNRLTIKVQVFDWDLDSDDDFMGQGRIPVDLSDDVTSYQDKLLNIPLQLLDEKKRLQMGGRVKVKAFLNVLQAYRTFGLGYIDKEEFKSAKTIKLEEEEHRQAFYEIGDSHQPVSKFDV